MHLLDTFMQGTLNEQEIVLRIGYSRRPQARYRLERQGISTFLLWLLWRKIGVKSGWARKKIFVHIEIFRLGSVDRWWCFWILTTLWNWKSRTFPFCLATISGPHVGVPWGGWTLVTRPDRYCLPEESTFHDPPENKARTVHLNTIHTFLFSPPSNTLI